MVDVELIQLCVPYGPLSNYMMLKGKSQVSVSEKSECRCTLFICLLVYLPIYYLRCAEKSKIEQSEMPY
ncbi:unnamed protein product [Haemonchus placei]|uniref:Ovule protein n=1 Tax=Haemonchus placei TaxID=6290 RepID=A0A0N4WAR8_HAEPC|nr:unnamed protein product [Haemonchus placei]